ncbi:MAG TPA: hypothetical protein OQH54_05790 [Nitrosopumilus sp.]|nr:hypothetical protein [Thermoproteota archaeon]HJJ23206.1 hypothetical protein [Nitrosopumilus sp.]
MNKNIAIIIGIAIFVLMVIFFVPLIDEFEVFNCITTPCEMPKITIHQWLHNQYPTISNFEECIAAGNPAMESYPRQCRTSDGQHFVEEISD